MSSRKVRPPTLDLPKIGRRIREIRGFDLTQAQFADMLGIRQNTISGYEKGRIVPTLEMLMKLKSYSGKSIDWIVSGEEKGSDR